MAWFELRSGRKRWVLDLGFRMRARANQDREQLSVLGRPAAPHRFEETTLEPTLARTADASPLSALAGTLSSPLSFDEVVPVEEAVRPSPTVETGGAATWIAGDDDADIDAESDVEAFDDENDDDVSDEEGDVYDEDDYDGDPRQSRRSRDDEGRREKRGKHRRHGHGSDRIRGRGTRRVID